MKKRTLVIVIAAAVALILGAVVWFFLSQEEETIIDPDKDPYATVSKQVIDLNVSRMATVEAKKACGESVFTFASPVKGKRSP